MNSILSGKLRGVAIVFVPEGADVKEVLANTLSAIDQANFPTATNMMGIHILNAEDLLKPHLSAPTFKQPAAEQALHLAIAKCFDQFGGVTANDPDPWYSNFVINVKAKEIPNDVLHIFADASKSKAKMAYLKSVGLDKLPRICSHILKGKSLY